MILDSPHGLGVRECLDALDTDDQRGLSSEAVTRRRKRYGPNQLDTVPPPPWWRKFLDQFRELVVLLLVAAALISGFVGEWLDAGFILGIVLLNALLGYAQEARAQRALDALAGMTAPEARVIRDGRAEGVRACALVPGDIVVLEAGDHVPADLRLISTTELQVQEAALTGESLPVRKDALGTLPDATPLAERRDMAYMGTMIVAGRGRGIVVATGMRSELGRVATLIRQSEPDPTPLQRRLAELGRTLVALCLVLVACIVVLQVLQGRALGEVFLFAVSLAVAAVPEGLPAIVTISLALGLQRMARRNAIVRKLPSVETLGSVTTICSDKTGTLTRNEMSVRAVATSGRVYRVSGSGHGTDGAFRAWPLPTLIDRSTTDDLVRFLQGDVEGLRVEGDETLLQALRVGLHCNAANLTETVVEGRTSFRVLGDPTEGALLVAARRAGLGGDPAPALSELPFDPERKRMSVIVDDEGQRVQYTKGAPEVILPLCDRLLGDQGVLGLHAEDRQRIETLAALLSSRALRTLALAYRPADGSTIEEQRLVFAGLAGMLDPPRREVRDAVERCRSAGIRPVMITGDHPATAMAIGRELGIAGDSDEAVTGATLDHWSDDTLAQRSTTTPIYARVSPEHKLRIVRALKAQGEIVAMTGDGVNDAPALRLADIGIAMGITGSDVTKEAAAMVLTDDNFASITAAVEEGRGIYDNIQKFVIYLLSCNSGELLFVFAASLLGWPVPLLAIQILWLNLVTDGLPALALGLERAEPDVMRRPPRPPHEPILDWIGGRKIVAHGGLMALVTLFAFRRGWSESEVLARTLAFATLSVSQLLFSLSCRSQRYTMPQLGPFTNPRLLGAIAVSAALQVAAINVPYLSAVVFKTTPLDLRNWLVVLGLALVPVTLVESTKILGAVYRRHSRSSASGPAARR